MPSNIKDNLTPDERLQVNQGVQNVTTYYRLLFNMSILRLNPNLETFYLELFEQQLLSALIKYDLTNFSSLFYESFNNNKIYLTNDMKKDLDEDLFYLLKDALDSVGDWDESLEQFNPDNWEYNIIKRQARAAVLGLEKTFGLGSPYMPIDMKLAKAAQRQTLQTLTIMPNQFKRFKLEFKQDFAKIESMPYTERKECVWHLIAIIAEDLGDSRLIEDIDNYRQYSW